MAIADISLVATKVEETLAEIGQGEGVKLEALVLLREVAAYNPSRTDHPDDKRPQRAWQRHASSLSIMTKVPNPLALMRKHLPLHSERLPHADNRLVRVLISPFPIIFLQCQATPRR